MKILVAVKRVVDHNVRVYPKLDGSGMDLNNVKMSVNPFCEIAIEEAVRLKETGIASEVIAVSVGPKVCQEQLRVALALGADRAVLVETNDEMQPLEIAKCLQKVVEQEQPEIVLLGKQSIDSDNNQTGQMLAALCSLPQGTFASKVNIDGDAAVTVTREIDGGFQTVKLTLPAVITTDLRLNEPRYLKLPDIMKAKKKPLDVIAFGDSGVQASNNIATLKVESPEARKAGIMVADVAELINKLKLEAKVI